MMRKMKMEPSYYKLALWKAYFEKGFSALNIVKYLIVLGGLWEGFATGNLRITLILGVIYIVFCFFLGWWMYRFGFWKAEIEVNNRINPFVKEMREKIK